MNLDWSAENNSLQPNFMQSRIHAFGVYISDMKEEKLVTYVEM